jgi:hypothetical protein
MKLAWQPWLYGLLAGLIGGGAGGVVTAISGIVALPGQVNIHDGFHSFLMLFYVSFAMHGLISVAFYLKNSPLPAVLDASVTVTTTAQPSSKPQTTTTTVSTGEVKP